MTEKRAFENKKKVNLFQLVDMIAMACIHKLLELRKLPLAFRYEPESNFHKYFKEFNSIM